MGFLYLYNPKNDSLVQVPAIIGLWLNSLQTDILFVKDASCIQMPTVSPVLFDKQHYQEGED